MTDQRPAHSIIAKLSARLTLLMVVVLGVLCGTIYTATWALHARAQDRLLTLKVNKLTDSAQSLLRPDDSRFFDLLQSNAQKRPGTRLELSRADGSPFYADPLEEPHLLSRHRASRSFSLPTAAGGTALTGTFTIDVDQDVRTLRSVGVVLASVALLCLAATWIATRLTVRWGLRPIEAITRQTERISGRRVRQRLRLRRPVSELQPWVAQFNSLLGRMDDSYAQLEAFNADVAHELRTPLTSLIGKTELALNKHRSADELGETLESNLDELRRMAILVNDMLFLSRSDRGAVARRGKAAALSEVIAEVVDFHEAMASEQGLQLEIVGEVRAAVDEPLLRRAVSNLISNATRYAERGSTVKVLLNQKPDGADIVVENLGPVVAGVELPRLFDRFYRADGARQRSDSHHGLGLAIVAAIARMHGGQVFATSDVRATRVGFSIGLAPV